MFPFKETANITFRDKNNHGTSYLLPSLKWGNLARVHEPSSKLHVPTMNVELASIFYSQSGKTREVLLLVWNHWDQTSLLYLLCSADDINTIGR